MAIDHKFELIWRHENTVSKMTLTLDEILAGAFAWPRARGAQEFDLFAKRQFTGLKDKNGKDIYEGDILTSSYYPFLDLDEKPYVGVVSMIFSQWNVVLHCVDSNRRGASHGMTEELNHDAWDESDISDWEIIGNIYEHPHLLEQK